MWTVHVDLLEELVEETDEEGRLTFLVELGVL
jgi:hypothetical protein